MLAYTYREYDLVIDEQLRRDRTEFHTVKNTEREIAFWLHQSIKYVTELVGERVEVSYFSDRHMAVTGIDWDIEYSFSLLFS